MSSSRSTKTHPAVTGAEARRIAQRKRAKGGRKDDLALGQRLIAGLPRQRKRAGLGARARLPSAWWPSPSTRMSAACRETA